MARPLQLQQAHHHLSFTTTTLLLVVAAIAAVSAVIFSLCTNHDKLSKHLIASKNKNKRRQQQHQQLPTSAPPCSMAGADHRKLVTALSGISSKVLVVAKMVSWKKPDSDYDGDDGDDGDDVVWKKSILMGEKCRPLDFSGQIIYDTEGKEVRALPSRVMERGGVTGGGDDGDDDDGDFTKS